jgi:hypothetical protein
MFITTCITTSPGILWSPPPTSPPDAINEEMSQPHFGLSVKMKFTLPKVGTWSPPGLPKTQSLIAEVKTLRIGVFFIPLESSWSVDVQNGLAWAIWTFSAQVMGKRRAGSQISSLTPDH